MSDKSVEEKLEELHAEILSLRELVGRALLHIAVPQCEREDPNDLVDAKFIANLFKCSVASVREGKAGTRGIRWFSRRPLKARRAAVMSVYRKRAGLDGNTPRERTIRLLDRKGTRRKSAA
jgi:hypothetical protein